ncbi:hypothetical protein BFL35_09415 [Clavibacter michiganensis]|nr:hypothetical protein BFL35_09415 [Clavibacter michiganensis]
MPPKRAPTTVPPNSENRPRLTRCVSMRCPPQLAIIVYMPMDSVPAWRKATSMRTTTDASTPKPHGSRCGAPTSGADERSGSAHAPTASATTLPPTMPQKIAPRFTSPRPTSRHASTMTAVATVTTSESVP